MVRDHVRTGAPGQCVIGPRTGRRREGAQQFAHRLHALIDTWTCLWCRQKLDPHSSGRFFYCSDVCRQASLEDQKTKRLRYLEKHPEESLF